jgi:hypothetical protein
VLAEPVDAVVSLATRQPLTAFTLSPTGKRLSPLAIRTRNDVASLETKEARSPWVVLVNP